MVNRGGAMNISGVVVMTSPERVDDVLKALIASGICEIHFHDTEGRIVVTIEGEDIAEEMERMKEIQGIPHVISASLAYSYAEDEILDAWDGIEKRGAVPEDL
ncbi:MAG: chaperone NapD [Thermodesulfovibrionales bacterium]